MTVDDKPMLRGGELPQLVHGRLDIILSSTAINILALALPVLLLQVYDRIIPNNAKETLFLLVFGVGTALILESGLKLGRSYLTARAGARFEHIASCRALGRTLGTSIDEFEKKATGAYLHRFSAVETLREFMSGQSLLIFIDLPFAIVFLAMIGYIGGSLVFVPLALLVLFTLVTLMVGSGLRNALDSQGVWDDRRYNFLIEVLTGIHTLKGLALESQMIRRYERLQESSAASVRDVSFRNNIAQGLGAVFSQVTLILVAAFGSVLVINESMTVGGLAACTLLSGRALQPLCAQWGSGRIFKISRSQSAASTNCCICRRKERRPRRPQPIPGTSGFLLPPKASSNSTMSISAISKRMTVCMKASVSRLNLAR